MHAIENLKRNKCIQLIDYLLAVSAMGVKSVRDIDGYEKHIFLSAIPDDASRGQNIWAKSDNNSVREDADVDHSGDPWLRFRLKTEPTFPALPKVLKGIVDDKPLREKQMPPSPELRASHVSSALDSQENTDDLIKSTWAEYLEKSWQPWCRAHTSWIQCEQIYNELFSIYKECERTPEDVEVVLGIGLLTMINEDGKKIRRHLLTATGELELKAHAREFSFLPRSGDVRGGDAEYQLELELDMIGSDQRPRRAEQEAGQKLSAVGISSLSRTEVANILKDIIYPISPRAKFIDDSDQQTTEKDPQVSFAPAIILRKRSNKSYDLALHRIREQLGQEGAPSSQLGTIIDINTDDASLKRAGIATAGASGAISTGGAPRSVALATPALSPSSLTDAASLTTSTTANASNAATASSSTTAGASNATAPTPSTTAGASNAATASPSTTAGASNAAAHSLSTASGVA
ncbi:MAG: hypothetical protein K0U66_00970, partial [Gammaproteobacteria bacterium]|nr:hypothetical protein [Gammaproteobacteria bacterium]